MEIRPYQPADRHRASTVDASFTVDAIAMLEVGPDSIGWSAIPSVPRQKSHELAEYLEDPAPPWSEGYVAEVDGRIVGFAALGFEPWNRRAVLWHMYVDRPARGTGVARALLNVIVARAREAGTRQVWLETQDTNVPAISAYEKLGFTIVGFDRSFYGNPPAAETAVFMSLSIE
jgi:ribosomal protein S18 acetylase RimI-like enzyme